LLRFLFHGNIDIANLLAIVPCPPSAILGDSVESGESALLGGFKAAHMSHFYTFLCTKLLAPGFRLGLRPTAAH